MMERGAAVRVETLVDDGAARTPDHLALIDGERRWTYAQLRAEVDRRALALVAAGIPTGAVILTTEPVTADVAIAFLALCRADCALFHLSPKASAAELGPLVARANPACALTRDGRPHPVFPALPSLPLDLPGQPSDRARAEAAWRSASGTAEATAIVRATSGTTGGVPKLACLPHRRLTFPRTPSAWWERPDEIVYIPRPNALADRLICVVLDLGATLVLSEATDPGRMEEEMVAHGVTSIWTVPAVVQLLVERVRPPRAGLTLRFVRTSAAFLPTAIAHAAERRYQATAVQEYGSTEGGAMMGTPPGTPPGSIGKPYAGIEARIVDEDDADLPPGAIGELLIRSPGMISGYRDDPAATARLMRDGWLATGDLTRCDGDGFYFLEGRRTLRINVGGFKVAPEEIEAVIAQHPGVREVAVLAMADAARGEVVRAVIVPRGERPAVSDLRHFCRARLAGYKVPRRFEFRADLPRSPLGKVLRHKL